MSFLLQRIRKGIILDKVKYHRRQIYEIYIFLTHSD